MRLTIAQLASSFDRSERTIERWIKDGKLQAASLPDGSYDVSGVLVENMAINGDAALLDRLDAIEERLANIERLLAGKQAHKQAPPQMALPPASGLMPIKEAAGLLGITHPSLYELLVTEDNKKDIGLVSNAKNGLQHYAEPKGKRDERIRSLSPEQLDAIRARRHK